MAKASLRSLEARMENQLRAFGYGPQEHELAMPEDYYKPGYPVVNEKYRSDLRKKKAAGAAIGVGAAVGIAKRKQIAGGVGTGMNYAGDALRKRAALGPAAQVLNPKGLRKATGQAGDLLLRGAKKLKGFRDLDAIIDLAERVAQMELEAEEELKGFNSNLLVGLPDDWQTTGREKAVFDRKGNMVKHKRVDYKQPRKGEPNLNIQKQNPDGTFSIDETFGRSDSRIRRAKAVGLAGLTAAGGYAAGKHGPKAIAAAKAARGKVGSVAGAAAARARQLLKK